MPELIFTDEITVKLIRHMAHDDYVVQAAQVSAKGENNPETEAPRLIRSLMKGKHGSPFEHNSFTFFVEAPIFVFREWQRHRISSFNEMSGRYTVLPSKFYIPGQDRHMINVGTKMKPDMQAASFPVWDGMRNNLVDENRAAWQGYQFALESGVSNEVARMILPVNIYSQMYWTLNARSLMNFLSLRSYQDGASVPSYPQREIQIAAEQVEILFATTMPHTYYAFVKNGRIAP